MNPRHPSPSLSILDAGGLRPGPARRMGRTAVWGIALAVALLAHLAFLVDLKDEQQPQEEPAPERMPIVVSQETIESLLGQNQSQPEPAGEDGAAANEAPAAPDPQEGDPTPAVPIPAQEDTTPPPPEDAAEEDAPPEPEEFDVPDPNATFDSLLEGTASNPASVAEDAPPPEADPAEAPSETPQETPAEETPTDALDEAPAPPESEVQPTPPQDLAAEAESDAPDAQASPASGPDSADPGGAPTETPGTPAPAQPSLALPDISSAFDVVSGASSDLAAALPDVADEEAREPQPQADAATSPTGETTERPGDPFYPFPLARPAAGARAPTFSQSEATALESVPVPPANPAPPAQRAAAEPKATAAPAEAAPSQTAAAPAVDESEGEQASYARAVRAIVGRAFFDAARLGQVGAGTAVVTVTISRDGRVIGAELSRPSGNESLDQAVLAAAYNEFPDFPATVGEGSLSFSVPIRVR